MIKQTKIIKKEVINFKDGYHLNSKHWQNWKNTLPQLTPFLFSVIIGMALSDAGIGKTHKHA